MGSLKSLARVASILVLFAGLTGCLSESGGPLPDALARGDLAEARRLLDGGVDPNATYVDGYTALMMTASADSRQAVTLLLNAGADPDQTTPGGKTALMIAASHGHLAVVEALLQAGADPALRDREGADALEMAGDAGHDEVVERLRTRGSPGSD